jgi:hypothetical protein
MQYCLTDCHLSSVSFVLSVTSKPIILSFIMLNVIMRCVIMLNVVMLKVVMLNVLMLNVVIQCVIMLSVVAPIGTWYLAISLTPVMSLVLDFPTL